MAKTGSVYIFNLSANDISTLNINNVPATITASSVTNPVSAANPLPGWGSASPYQPNGTGVARSAQSAATNPNVAFSQTDVTNTVYVLWATSSLRFSFNLSMQGRDPSLREDFLLYISTSQAILFDMYGTSLLTITNPTAASAMSKAMLAKSKSTKKSSSGSKSSKKGAK